MLLHNASEWSKSKPIWLGLLVCTLSTAVATLLRLAIHDFVQPSLPFQIFYISVILTTFYFGWVYGLLASVLATVSGFYFFISPYDSFEIPSIADCYVIAVNISTMMACVFTIEYLQRSTYSSSVVLKASKNNYRLFIRSENQLLNLKKDIAEYENFMRTMTSTEDHALLWADPYEVICFFEKCSQIIPASILAKAEGKFLNFFPVKLQPFILNHINTCLSENTIVEFSFIWPTGLENEPVTTGRLSRIHINHKKSLIFSVNKH